MCGQPDRIEQTAIGQRRRIVNCKTMLRDFPSFIQIDHRIKVGRERDHVAVSYMSPAVSGDCRPKHPPLSPCVVADFQDGCRKDTSPLQMSPRWTTHIICGETQLGLPHSFRTKRSRSQTPSAPLIVTRRAFYPCRRRPMSCYNHAQFLGDAILYCRWDVGPLPSFLFIS